MFFSYLSFVQILNVSQVLWMYLKNFFLFENIRCKIWCLDLFCRVFQVLRIPSINILRISYSVTSTFCHEDAFLQLDSYKKCRNDWMQKNTENQIHKKQNISEKSSRKIVPLLENKEKYKLICFVLDKLYYERHICSYFNQMKYTPWKALPGRNWEPRSPSFQTMWWVVGRGWWVVLSLLAQFLPGGFVKPFFDDLWKCDFAVRMNTNYYCFKFCWENSRFPGSPTPLTNFDSLREICIWHSSVLYKLHWPIFCLFFFGHVLFNPISSEKRKIGKIEKYFFSFGRDQM